MVERHRTSKNLQELEARNFEFSCKQIQHTCFLVYVVEKGEGCEFESLSAP